MLGGEGGKILKEPAAFVQEKLPSLSEEQKNELKRMYVVRGDILMQLGRPRSAPTKSQFIRRKISFLGEVPCQTLCGRVTCRVTLPLGPALLTMLLSCKR